VQAASTTSLHSGGAINAGRSASHLQYTWDRPSFWPYWEREHRACRESVCLIDMSFMSKFLVQGRDAGAALNR
jgi:4-methylaminobutanoate oxidase (formaldehyde-forming)